MITHFPKMRRYIKLASVLAPALSFLAVMMYSGGFVGLALLAVVSAFVCGCAFPHEKVLVESFTQSKWDQYSILNLTAMLLFMYWFASLDGFHLLIDEVFSASALWDWRLITAVFIWHFHWGYTGFKKASDISDEAIVGIFEEDISNQTKRKNEMDLTDR